MRPVRLEMHGFAAFREPTVVDFAGAEYFALVGPTGSGKSTVIDAMTFALYGSVPRWDDRRTVALALAPTANRGTVRLVFEVGACRYVAVRELRRAPNGGVTVRNASLERLLDPSDPDGDTEPLASDSAVSKCVEELLGLPFEQFCVCVVLPQGDFAQFLHAKPAERQKTLTRILGLGVYETIAKQAGAEAAAQRQRAELLSDQLTGYADATDTAIADADRRLDELAALAERVAEALPALASADAELADAQRAAQRLRSEATALAEVRAPAGLKELADRASASGARTATARAALEQAEREDTAARELLDAAPATEPLHQIRRDYAELAGLVAGAANLVADLERAGTHAVVARSSTAAAVAQLETARAAVDAAAATREAVRAEAERLSTERDRLAEVRVPSGAATLAEQHRVAAADLGRARREVTDAETADDAARAALAAAVETLAAVRARHDELTRVDQAAALRSGLVASAPCPVCEQSVPSLPPSRADSTASGLAASWATLQGATDQVERLTEAAASAEAATRAARINRDRAEAADAEAARWVADAKAQLRAVRDPLVAFGAPAPDDDLVGSWTALAGWAEAAAAERTRRLVALDRAAAEAAHTEVTLAYTAAATTVQRCRTAEADAARVEHDARGALDRADRRRAELTEALTGAPTAAEAAEQLAELARLATRAKAANAGLRAARAAFAEAGAAAEQIGDQLHRGWRELAAARDPLVGLGAPVAVRQPDGVPGLLASWRELADWAAAEAADRRHSGAAAEAVVARAAEARIGREQVLLEELRAHELSPTPGKSVAAEAPVVVAAAFERARGAADRLRERQAEARKLAKDRDQAREAHQVANTLARLLRSNEFPRWLVASALDTLVADASRRLAELSGGQFELTHADGEFLVVDHADADTRRPVKTLSGGETFQASLALALALSEQLSTLAAAGAARLDSIFLDEGFGTLDEANLEMVAATLENLASFGDRMVGVVTHVPALAERVPVRYVVSRDQRTASIIREGM
ncbi:MAG: AAA family ATPase [Pseudonocardia sp.]